MKQWELRDVTVPEPEGHVVHTSPRRRKPSLRIPEVGALDAPDALAFRALADQLPAVFWTTDTDLRFTSSLGASLAELGLGPNQVVGATLLDLLETDDRSFNPIDAHLLALAGSSTTFQMWWAGRPFHCRVSPLRDSQHDVIGTVCVAIDDTGETLTETSSPLWRTLDAR